MVAAGAVFEAYGAGVGQGVEVGQKLGDGLVAGAWFVAAGDVGDLDVLDDVAIRAQRRAGIAAHHPDVVLVELQPHVGSIDRLHERGGALGRIGEVARHIGRVDVFDEQHDASLLGQRRGLPQVGDGGLFGGLTRNASRQHPGNGVEPPGAKDAGCLDSVANAALKLLLRGQAG